MASNPAFNVDNLVLIAYHQTVPLAGKAILGTPDIHIIRSTVTMLKGHFVKITPFLLLQLFL